MTGQGQGQGTGTVTISRTVCIHQTELRDTTRGTGEQGKRNRDRGNPITTTTIRRVSSTQRSGSPCVASRRLGWWLLRETSLTDSTYGRSPYHFRVAQLSGQRSQRHFLRSGRLASIAYPWAVATVRHTCRTYALRYMTRRSYFTRPLRHNKVKPICSVWAVWE